MWQKGIGERAFRSIARALAATGDELRQLPLSDVEGLSWQRRVHFVVGQQFDTAREVLLPYLKGEVVSGRQLGSDFVQRFLESNAVQRLCSV